MYFRQTNAYPCHIGAFSAYTQIQFTLKSSAGDLHTADVLLCSGFFYPRFLLNNELLKARETQAFRGHRPCVYAKSSLCDKKCSSARGPSPAIKIESSLAHPTQASSGHSGKNDALFFPAGEKFKYSGLISPRVSQRDIPQPQPSISSALIPLSSYSSRKRRLRIIELVLFEFRLFRATIGEENTRTTRRSMSSRFYALCKLTSSFSASFVSPQIKYAAIVAAPHRKITANVRQGGLFFERLVYQIGSSTAAPRTEARRRPP